jgi:hypothetical protein
MRTGAFFVGGSAGSSPAAATKAWVASGCGSGLPAASLGKTRVYGASSYTSCAQTLG